MPGIHGQFGRAKSRLSSRGRIKTQKPVEVFESSHPERYGLDESYPGVVVVQEKGDGQVIEAHPTKDYKSGVRLAKKLQKQYGV